ARARAGVGSRTRAIRARRARACNRPPTRASRVTIAKTARCCACAREISRSPAPRATPSSISTRAPTWKARARNIRSRRARAANPPSMAEKCPATASSWTDRDVDGAGLHFARALDLHEHAIVADLGERVGEGHGVAARLLVVVVMVHVRIRDLHHRHGH